MRLRRFRAERAWSCLTLHPSNWAILTRLPSVLLDRVDRRFCAAGPIDSVSRCIASPISQLYCCTSLSCRATANEKFWVFDGLAWISRWAGFARVNCPKERCSRCSFPSTRWRSSFCVVSDFDTHVSPETFVSNRALLYARSADEGNPSRHLGCKLVRDTSPLRKRPHTWR